MKPTSIVIIIIIAVCAFGAFDSIYTIDETEQVVITQFGKIIGEAKKKPGIHFKWPIIQEVHPFKRNILDWDGQKDQMPTEEKKLIWVDSFARWRIEDPIKFFESVTNEQGGLSKLNDIINSQVRNIIASHYLIEAVRKSNRPMKLSSHANKNDIAAGKVKIPSHNNPDLEKKLTIETGREKLTKKILAAAQPKLKEFGIELVDVKIKRINYVESVRESVYRRMIGERNQIAEKLRSEGKGEAQKILGNKERDLKEILSTAYRKTQEVKGKADAEATHLYADAYSKDPEFYSFIQSLETYKKSLNKDNALIMSTNSDLLKYLKGIK